VKIKLAAAIAALALLSACRSPESLAMLAAKRQVPAPVATATPTPTFVPPVVVTPATATPTAEPTATPTPTPSLDQMSKALGDYLNRRITREQAVAILGEAKVAELEEAYPSLKRQ